MEIHNYTGSPVSVKLDYSGGEKTFYPIKEAKLLTQPKKRVALTVDHLPIYTFMTGTVVNLPKENQLNDVLYIVTEEVAKAVGHLRNDLLVMENPTFEKGMFKCSSLFVYV
jgi:hypothetical protein